MGTTDRTMVDLAEVLFVDNDGKVVDGSLGAAGGACWERFGSEHCSPNCPAVLIRQGQSRSMTHAGKSISCKPMSHNVAIIVQDAGEEPPRLSTREQEVLSLVAKGFTSREIARILGIAFATARTHVENVRKKLDAHTQAEAVARAVSFGLIAA